MPILVLEDYDLMRYDVFYLSNIKGKSREGFHVRPILAFEVPGEVSKTVQLVQQRSETLSESEFIGHWSSDKLPYYPLFKEMNLKESLGDYSDAFFNLELNKNRKFSLSYGCTIGDVQKRVDIIGEWWIGNDSRYLALKYPVETWDNKQRDMTEYYTLIEVRDNKLSLDNVTLQDFENDLGTYGGLFISLSKSNKD